MRLRKNLIMYVAVVLATVTWAAAQQRPYVTPIMRPPTLNVTSNSATVSWTTATPNDSYLWYGTNPGNLTERAGQGGQSTQHQVQITNLEPNTKYYFQMQSQQAPGSTFQQSGIYQFTTTGAGAAPVAEQAQAAQNAPANVGQVQITNGPMIETANPNSATIAWSTDKKGSSRVSYGTSPSALSQFAEAPWGAGGLTHRVNLTNLQPNTTYYFQVQTGQAAGAHGAATQSRVYSLHTPAQGQAPVKNQPAQPAS